MRSQRFDLEMPDGFPLAELEAIHSHLSDLSEARRNTPEWTEWAGACNGILYRYTACDEHCEELAASLDQSTSPPQPERYRQERLLFSFFVEGPSCIECFYYGFYFVGAMIDASAFAPGINRRNVTPAEVVRRYRCRFQSEGVTETRGAIVESEEMRAWGAVRNLLAHRASPGRAFFAGSAEAEWLDEPLSGNSILKRRLWLADAMQALLARAVNFVQQQVV
jgi:hypothetical protein